MAWHGGYLTLNISELPKTPSSVHCRKFWRRKCNEVLFESDELCAGILRRAEKRGKELPEHLLSALEKGGGKGYLGLDDGAMTLGGRPQWVFNGESILGFDLAQITSKNLIIAIRNGVTRNHH